MSEDIALISTHGQKDVRQLVAHEVGHLFGIRPKSSVDPEHCAVESCLMYPVTKMVEREAVDVGTKMKRLKAKFGRPETKLFEISSMLYFCSNCEADLQHRAPIVASKMAQKTMRNFSKL